MQIRWRFTDPAEDGERARVLQRIDEWWIAFAANVTRVEAAIVGKESWGGITQLVNDHLQAIDGRLVEWELAEGHRLVITAGWEPSLAPLIEAILRRAPRLRGWTFSAWRPPLDAGRARLHLHGRLGVDLEEFRFRVTREGFNLLSLDVACSYDDPLIAASAAKVLLGEELVHRWIGFVTPARRTIFDRLARAWLRAEELRPFVESEIESMLDTLPQMPLCRYQPPKRGDDLIGNVVRCRPEVKSEYPAREDLLTLSVPLHAQPIVDAVHLRRNFHSSRFSRFGETFCYLKLEGPLALDDRGNLERALDEALDLAGLGATLCGGTGLAYSYVDLALLQVERAMNVMRPILQSRGLRGWLLFFDEELAGEWIGLQPDAPPPPVRADRMVAPASAEGQPFSLLTASAASRDLSSRGSLS